MLANISSFCTETLHHYGLMAHGPLQMTVPHKTCGSVQARRIHQLHPLSVNQVRCTLEENHKPCQNLREGDPVLKAVQRTGNILELFSMARVLYRRV